MPPKLFEHNQFFFELADGLGISAALNNYELAQKLNLINGNHVLVFCLILLNKGPKIFWAG